MKRLLVALFFVLALGCAEQAKVHRGPEKMSAPSAVKHQPRFEKQSRPELRRERQHRDGMDKKEGRGERRGEGRERSGRSVPK